MDSDALFLSAVIRVGSLAAFQEVPKAHLAPAWHPVYDFIVDFVKDQRKLPRRDTVEASLNCRFPEAPEDPSFYARSIRDNAMRAHLEDALVTKVGQPLRESKPEEAIRGAKEVLADVARNFRSKDAGLLLLDQRDNVDDRWRDYYLRKKSQDILGLPLPWQTLTRATGGFQPADSWLLCARPNVGKSWLMLLFGIVLWQYGFRILFCSEETPPQNPTPRDKNHRVINARCIRCNLLGASASQLCEAALTPRQRLSVRFDAIAARVSAWRLLKGALTPQEERRLGLYYQTAKQPESVGWGQFRLVSAPAVKTLADVEAQVLDFQPDLLLWDSAYQGITTKDEQRKLEAASDFILDTRDMIQRHQVPGCLSWHLKREVDEGATDCSLNDIALTDEAGKAFDNVIALFRPPELERVGEAIVRSLKTRDGLKTPELRIRMMLRDEIDFQELGEGSPGMQHRQEGHKA